MQIGTFTSTGVGYAGHIKTLTLDAQITLEPNRSTSAKSPDFRVFSGTTELGYAYKETSESGVDYLSMKLDDPSFAYPIYCSLFLTSKTEDLALVWNRPKKKAA